LRATGRIPGSNRTVKGAEEEQGRCAARKIEASTRTIEYHAALAPLADVEAAAGIVTDGRDGTARAPAVVSTATEPLPALSIQIAGPTETPQGLINVGSVTSAGTDPGQPSEIMLVCTYVLLVCATAPIRENTGDGAHYKLAEPVLPLIEIEGT
jgi:hypothetical protein